MAARKKKEPLHQIFYLCSSYTPDAAWKEFLKDCSFGKFPKGVRFENGTIKCVRKKQAFTETIPNDAEQALSVIITIFRDKLGIRTVREKKNASNKFELALDDHHMTSWKDATTLAAKTCLLRNYAERCASHFMLTSREQDDLILLLTLAARTKVLDHERIHLTNNVIGHIDGLHFDPSSRRLTLEGHLPKQPPASSPVPLDFNPTPQINHPALYSRLLDRSTGPG
jgi:hypothetical protein